MALVRCSCVTELEPGPRVLVILADPECEYVPHRLAGLELVPVDD